MTVTLPVSYRDIPHTDRVALWPLHAYRGNVTLVAGPKGKGKGLVGIHAVAATVRGATFPGEPPLADGEPPRRAPASAIGIWGEDDPNEDLAERWNGALGTGLTDEEKDRIFDLTEVSEGALFRFDDSGASEALLRAVIDILACCDGSLSCACQRCEVEGHEHDPHPGERRYPVGIVLIDPLLAVASIRSDKAARLLAFKLQRLAKETGVAILILHHTNKDGKTIAGSPELVRAIRLVFQIEEQETSPGVYFLRPESTNNLGNVPTLAYGIVGSPSGPYLLWADPYAEERRGRGTLPRWRRR